MRGLGRVLAAEKGEQRDPNENAVAGALLPSPFSGLVLVTGNCLRAVLGRGGAGSDLHAVAQAQVCIHVGIAAVAHGAPPSVGVAGRAAALPNVAQPAHATRQVGDGGRVRATAQPAILVVALPVLAGHVQVCRWGADVCQ